MTYTHWAIAYFIFCAFVFTAQLSSCMRDERAAKRLRANDESFKITPFNVTLLLIASIIPLMNVAALIAVSIYEFHNDRPSEPQ